MTMKFSGTIEQLRVFLHAQGIHGSWMECPNGVFMLRLDNGSNVHWASGSKTPWFDGKKASAKVLAEAVAAALHWRKPVSICD